METMSTEKKEIVVRTTASFLQGDIVFSSPLAAAKKPKFETL